MDGLISFAHKNKMKVFFNDHPKPLNTTAGGSGSSDPSAVLAPAETAFRFDGLSSLMKRGLDFWWYDCHNRNHHSSLLTPLLPVLSLLLLTRAACPIAIAPYPTAACPHSPRQV
jgi:hypothetical protein